MIHTLLAAQAAAPSAPTAGGATLHDVVVASGISAIYFAFTGWILVRERIQGKRTALGRALDAFGAKIGLPGWAAAPFVITPPFLLLAGFGVYWDVPLHMQKGRDDGAFANPSHYPIFLALLALLNIAMLIMALAKDPLPRHTLKLAPGWKVPFSSVVIFLAGFIGVLGFPLDDLWHRIFGQDVTEWGPTHVLMIGGAITAPWSLPLLRAEAKQIGAPLMNGRLGRWVMALALALCIVPFAFLMEFDLGVPQFPASTQGLIFSFVLGFTCVATRLWFGKGGALFVSALWVGAHLFLVAVVAVIPHVLTIQFLTSVPFAVLVELVALALGVDRNASRRLPFAVVAGMLGGSLGYYLEWVWSKDHMPLPQPFNEHALPFLIAVSTIAGLGGGLLGVWKVRRLENVADVEVTAYGSAVPTASFRWLGLAGFATFVALMAVCAPPMKGEVHTATVHLSDVSTGAENCTAYEVQCLATVTLHIDGKDPVPDATWFYALAWQGYPGTDAFEKVSDIPTDPTSHVPGLVRARMVATGEPGTYRSEHPLPLYGQWKTLIRIHEGTNDMMSWAMYMPDDPAITSDRGREVRVLDGDAITSQYEPHLLQRERKDSIPEGLYAAGNYVVLSLWIIVLLGFGYSYNTAAGTSRRKASETAKVSA